MTIVFSDGIFFTNKETNGKLSAQFLIYLIFLHLIFQMAYLVALHLQEDSLSVKAKENLTIESPADTSVILFSSEMKGLYFTLLKWLKMQKITSDEVVNNKTANFFRRSNILILMINGNCNLYGKITFLSLKHTLDWSHSLESKSCLLETSTRLSGLWNNIMIESVCTVMLLFVFSVRNLAAQD